MRDGVYVARAILSLTHTNEPNEIEGCERTPRWPSMSGPLRRTVAPFALAAPRGAGRVPSPVRARLPARAKSLGGDRANTTTPMKHAAPRALEMDERQMKSVRTLRDARPAPRTRDAAPAPVARNLPLQWRATWRSRRALLLPGRCARHMRRAPLHWLAHNLVASQATSGVGRRAPAVPSTTHATRTAQPLLPDLSALLAAPNAPPTGPPDDDIVERLTIAGLCPRIRMPLPPRAMERRRVHKMPTVSSFSRQSQRVVRARRL